jgi:hypothetical protein
MLLNPITMEYQRVSLNTSSFLNKTKLHSLKLPEHEYKNFILVRKGNVFEKKFRKTKSTISNIKLKIVKENNNPILPKLSKKDLFNKNNIKYNQNSKKSKNLLIFYLGQLEKAKNECISNNEFFNNERQNFIQNKRKIQNNILNTKSFLRDNMKKIKILRESMNEFNYCTKKKNEFLKTKLVDEIRKVNEIKNKMKDLEKYYLQLSEKVNNKNLIK